MASHRLGHLTHDEWMRPKCSICAAAREGQIDIPRVEALLAAGARLKPVAEKFGINAYSLRRHWQAVSPTRKTYLRFGTRLSQQALQARVAEERLAAIDHLVLVRNGLHQAFALALAASDYNAVAPLIRLLAPRRRRPVAAKPRRERPSGMANRFDFCGSQVFLHAIVGSSNPPRDFATTIGDRTDQTLTRRCS
jgi:hypothetical protein